MLGIYGSKPARVRGRRKAFGELYRVIPFSSCACNATLVFIFSHIQTSIEEKCKRAPLVLHRFVRHKYLREDHSMAQTVVQLSSSYMKSFWRTSCFFPKGQFSGIAKNKQKDDQYRERMTNDAADFWKPL